jgi:hypothetical protein
MSSSTEKPGIGDIVIPTSGLNNEQVAAILGHLSELGCQGFLAGDESMDTVDADETSVDAKVSEWRTAYGTSVDTRYLETVSEYSNTANRRPLLTNGSFKKVFSEIFGTSTSTSISSGKVYNHAADLISGLHQSRQYLQSGAIFLGDRPPGPGYKFTRPYWGITPEALYGLTLEDSQASKLGKIAIVRCQQLLARISDFSTDVQIQRSDWQGYGRS